MPAWMDQLCLTRAWLRLRPSRPWRVPPRPEVTVRGALGAALWDVACVRPHRSCAGCDRAGSCPIPQWWERAHGATGLAPYRIAASAEGGADTLTSAPLRVELTLFAPPPQPSLLLAAIAKMASAGLGPSRVPHEVERLTVAGAGAQVVVIEREAEVGAWPAPGRLSWLVEVPERAVGARVRLRTPMQLKCDDPPSAADLLRAALMRARALARDQGVKLDHRWPEPEGGAWASLEHVAGGRWSQRSQGTQDLSGWLGEARFGPEARLWFELLAFAEVAGLGRGTTAGLGAVEVRWDLE